MSSARRGRVGVDQPPGGVQRQAHRDQPGLRPVVQVALDAAQLRRPGVQRLAPGLRQVPDAQLELRLLGGGEHQPGEVGVAAQQQGCRPQPGRHERQADREHHMRPVAQQGLQEDDHSEPGEDRGQQQQDQPRGRVDHEPQQVPPRARITQQPAHPPLVAEPSLTARGRLVSARDRHAAPPLRQPPGEHGQPPYGQQRDGQHETAADQAGDRGEHVARDVTAAAGASVRD